MGVAKFAIPTILGVGGIGLIASNWVFKKEEIIRIEKEDDWHLQTINLLQKVKEDPEGMAKKIGGENSDALSLNDLGFFNLPENAKTALEMWCKKNEDPDKQLLEELCNFKRSRNWLFQ